MQGTILALGLQRKASLFLLISLYVVGLPLCFLLGFYYGYGVIGLELGFCIGSCITAFSFLMILYLSDWQTVADEAV